MQSTEPIHGLNLAWPGSYDWPIGDPSLVRCSLRGKAGARLVVVGVVVCSGIGSRHFHLRLFLLGLWIGGCGLSAESLRVHPSALAYYGEDISYDIAAF